MWTPGYTETHTVHSLPEGLNQVKISELMEVNESLKNFDVEVVPAVQKEKQLGYKRMTYEEKCRQDIMRAGTFLRDNLL